MLVFSEVVEMRRAVQRLRQSAPQRGQQRAQLAAPRARPQRHRRRYTHLYVLCTLRQLAQLRDHLLLFTFITSTTNYTCGRFLSKKVWFLRQTVNRNLISSSGRLQKC